MNRLHWDKDKIRSEKRGEIPEARGKFGRTWKLIACGKKRGNSRMTSAFQLEWMVVMPPTPMVPGKSIKSCRKYRF